MKCSMALNSAASMPWTSRRRAHFFSLASPKNSAMKSGDLAASTTLCAGNVLPETTNAMSDPVPLRRSSLRCRSRSVAGTGSDAGTSTLGRCSRSTVMAHFTVRVPSAPR
ncbi:hypothetical protein VPH35_131818 [Triticum aestivum]